MKKIFICLFCCSILLGCVQGKTQTLGQFFEDAGMQNTDKIEIVDGSSGEKKVLIEEDKIVEFISLIENIEITPQKDQSPRDGWSYSITLFEDEKQFQFTLNKIEKIFYESNPELFPLVDNFYKNLTK